MKSANEILDFLARTWAERQNLKVFTDSDEFSASPTTLTVNLMDYNNPHKLDDITGIDRWRLWRFSTFHEAMHIVHSTYDIQRMEDEVADAAHATRDSSSAFALVNIIDDYRIERIGLRTYKGYIEEQDFVDKLLQPTDLAELNHDTDFRKAVILFHYALTKNIFPKRYAKEYRDLVDHAKSVESIADLRTASTYVLKKLIEIFGQPENETMREYRSSIDTARTLDERLPEASDAIKQEYARVQRYEEAQASIDDLVKTDINDFMPEAQLEIGNITERGDLSIISHNTRASIDRLVGRLRAWQTGWDEKLDYVGDEIDIDAFIVSRRDKGKYFTNEAQVKPPNTLALLLDTSGSVESMIDEYLKSIYIISEALNYFHIKFSIFVFHSNYLYVVKPSYQAWDRTIAERLASLDSDGGTPLGNALKIVEMFAPRYGFDHIVVITDGKPNDETRAHTVVHEIASNGLRVSFLGFVVKEKNFYNGFFKKMSAEGHTVSIIDGLKSLPEAFFDLVSDVWSLK